MTKTKRHFIIPDTQVRADEPQDHWAWIEEAVVEYQPDTLWHLGDHWDMPSLSRYDAPGSKKMANTSYQRDIDSGNKVITRFSSNLKKRKVTAKKKYLLGNHDERVAREVNANPKFEGKIGYQDFALVENDWQVYDYHEVAWEDGIAFSHYFYYPKTGKPIGGSIDNRLNRIGCSFVQGHEQGFLYGNRDYPTGRTYHGLVAGSAYLHYEDYKGHQGNSHFRGVVILNGVRDGSYCIMPLDFNYLCEKYEGVPLHTYLKKKYKNPSKFRGIV